MESNAAGLTIAILGTGSMGRYWAYQLQHLNPFIVGTVSSPYAVWDDSRRSVIHPSYYHWHATPAKTPNIVILSVKWRTIDAAAHWIEQFAPHALVISTMNGMGQENSLAHLQHLTLCLGTTTTAVSRHDLDGSEPEIAIKSHGITALPILSDARLEWFRQWAHPGEGSIEWLPSDQMRSMRWQKLLQNSVINPLTAIAGCSNGALASMPIFNLRIPLLREGMQVAIRKGIALPEDMSLRVVQLIEATSANRSSMLQDVLDGQPTEIAAINGYIVAEAQKLGLNAPTHAALIALMTALQ